MKQKNVILYDPQSTEKAAWQGKGNHQVPQNIENLAMDSEIAFILVKLKNFQKEMYTIFRNKKNLGVKDEFDNTIKVLNHGEYC